MDRFFDYIEKYKFAILGTVLFHVVFFLSTNFVTVQRPFKIVEDITEVEIETDAIEMDEELLEMLNRQNELANEQLYNVASDANDTRERSYENFSSQEIDEQVMNEARNLEQKYFEEWASTHDNGDEGSESASQPSDETTPRPNTESQVNQRNNQVDNSGGNAFAGQVMVSFNLPNRKAHALEVPGYTCYGSGTVVIQIKVDKTGAVKDASFSSGASSGATECMIEKARRYARRARFNYSDAGGVQTGTITYKFQGQ